MTRMGSGVWVRSWTSTLVSIRPLAYWITTCGGHASAYTQAVERQPGVFPSPVIIRTSVRGALADRFVVHNLVDDLLPDCCDVPVFGTRIVAERAIQPKPAVHHEGAALLKSHQGGVVLAPVRLPGQVPGGRASAGADRPPAS